MTAAKILLVNIAVLVVSQISAGAWMDLEGINNVYISSPDVKTRIIGEEYVPSIELTPYMALVNFNSSDLGVSCTATILSPRHVLTAAHCMTCNRIKNDEGFVCANNDTIGIYAGSLNPGLETKHVGYKRFYIHPEYTEVDKENTCIYNYDIAVVELDQKLQFSNKISKVILPLPQSQKSFFSVISKVFPKNKKCIVVGWGLNTPEPLKWASVEMLDKLTCQTRLENMVLNYPFLESFTNNGMCASTQICTTHPISNKFWIGDSGGPLICDGVQVGIVSWASQVKYETTVYTKVGKLVEWVSDIISRT